MTYSPAIQMLLKVHSQNKKNYLHRQGIISWNSNILSSEHTVLQSTAENRNNGNESTSIFFCFLFRNWIWIHFSTNSQIQHHTYNYFLNIVYASKFTDEIFLHWPNLEKFHTSLLSCRIAIIYKMNESCK
jgi:hypothetical protein